MSLSPSPQVVVVGAGVIGLSCAWELARSGAGVTVVGTGGPPPASDVAAGMLAAVTEAHFTEPDLASANVSSLSMWPGFAADVEAASGKEVGLETAGTYVVGSDPADREALMRLGNFVASLGLRAEWVGSRELRREEPLVSPSVRGALFAPGDYSVNNRWLRSALLAACVSRGVELVAETAEALTTRAGVISGVSMAGGRELGAEAVVLAAGAWSASLRGVPAELASALRPVKGHILRLRPTERAGTPPLLGHTLRALVAGRPAYLVPRRGGEIVVGATSEERGFDERVEAGAVGDLLADARTVLPAVEHCELAEIAVGFRPGSFDNLPLVGAMGPQGLVVACGHYRNGILLAPLTAKMVAETIMGRSGPEVACFSPRRLGGGRSVA